MPEAALVDLADRATARVVAALGAHPAIMGGGGGNGSVDREASRQMRKFIMQPMARLIEENAWRVFGERIRIWWEPGVDALLVKAKTADALTKMGVDPQAALKIARVTVGNVKMAPKPEPPPRLNQERATSDQSSILRRRGQGDRTRSRTMPSQHGAAPKAMYRLHGRGLRRSPRLTQCARVTAPRARVNCSGRPGAPGSTMRPCASDSSARCVRARSRCWRRIWRLAKAKEWPRALRG